MRPSAPPTRPPASSMATRSGSTTSSGNGPLPRRWPTPPGRAPRSGWWGCPAGGTAADEAEFSASGTVIKFAGFLRAYVEGSDDEAETTERDVELPALVEGDTLSAQDARSTVAHHPTAGPLHRGVAREGPRGARHRPALDLRQHPRHHSEPGIRLEEGHGPGAVVHGVRGGGAARALLRRPRRLRLHRGDGGRPRRDRPR